MNSIEYQQSPIEAQRETVLVCPDWLGTPRTILYFGCIKDSGHYLWINEGFRCYNRSTLERYAKIAGITDGFIQSIDGTYTPLISAQGAYKESIVPPFRIISWNDYTVDRRPGSNSTLLGIGYKDAAELLADAANCFPSVMQRQTVPLYLASQLVPQR